MRTICNSWISLKVPEKHTLLSCGWWWITRMANNELPPPSSRSTPWMQPNAVGGWGHILSSLLPSRGGLGRQNELSCRTNCPEKAPPSFFLTDMCSYSSWLFSVVKMVPSLRTQRQYLIVRNLVLHWTGCSSRVQNSGLILEPTFAS